MTGLISGFRFLGWLVVEIELDDGTIGIGNAALSPHATKTVIDTYLRPLPGRSRNTSPRFRSKNELFWYTFDGEPVAKDGFIDLSDTAPGFGLTLKPVDANFKLTR